MRKRGAIRIPQDILPWARVTKIEEDTINIYTKKQSQWVSGNRRYYQTKLFNSQRLNSLPLTLVNFQSNDSRIIGAGDIFSFQNGLRNYDLNGFKGRSLPRNFCLFLGCGRTFNRKLFISRQILRKLTRTGLISGLQK